MMTTRMHFLAAIAVALGLGCSGCDDDGDADTESCDAGVGLTASAPSKLTDGSVTVTGTTSPGRGVTVQAVYVAGVLAARTEFNYRGFSVEVPEAKVRQYAEGNSATLPVTAFVSPYGCTVGGVTVVIELQDGDSVDGGSVDASVPDATAAPDAPPSDAMPASDAPPSDPAQP